MRNAALEFEKLLDLMARLRAPDGCPWDREQTLDSLRPFILEEAYELTESIQRNEPDWIREELGDLLLEVVFVNQIALEAGLFSMAEVIRGIREKLIRRHPHVFSKKSADDADEALLHWDSIKAREKPDRDSLLDGVPRALPSLARAAKLSRRAARGGFDWASREDVARKVREELAEVERAIEAGNEERVHEEIGDLLFAVVNLARHSGLDAELALADANEKFSERFRYMEEALRSSGRSVEDASLDELEELWLEAKRHRS